MSDNNPDDKYEGRTYLFIRDHPADNGSEPLPAGLPCWVSPDITVIQPNGVRGTEAVANQANQVEVRVNNAGGVDAVNAYVELFFGNSATGFTPTTAVPVGADFLTIPGYSSQTISFPWVPPASYAGHGCFLGRVSLIIPPDTYANPNIFDVRMDRHVTQRNIEVLSPSPETRRVEFPFFIVNPTAEPTEAQVFLQEVLDPAEMAQLRISLGCRFAAFAEAPLAYRAMAVSDTNGEPAEKIALKLEPWESRKAVLLVEQSPDTRPGDLSAIHVVQSDNQGLIYGGLMIVVYSPSSL